jgi:hypothetical protein
MALAMRGCLSDGPSSKATLLTNTFTPWVEQKFRQQTHDLVEEVARFASGGLAEGDNADFILGLSMW